MKKFMLSFYCILALQLFISCSKDEVQPELMISSFTPETGPYSTIVTISGSGFSTTINENVVFFNDLQAVIQDATPTTITAIVPKAAGTGPIIVQRGTKTASSSTNFNFISTITVSTFAGSGIQGFADGNSSAAQFSFPKEVSTDAQGNVYVADLRNYRIRKITPSGVVSSLAGSGTAGFTDGNGNAALFDDPFGVATDIQGNVYVADAGNHRIRKITPSGEVSTLAGSGTAGFTDGNGSVAQFSFPKGIATDAQGNVYVADNYRIRKITPSGVVSSLAGSGTAGFADGSGNAALFNSPYGVATDIQGNVYVADAGNHRIRKITPSGEVSTLAGSGTAGFADGNGSAAQFNSPDGVATDIQGNVYVADSRNHRIRKITPSGEVSTLAGSGTAGFADGNGSTAQFNSPGGIATDTQGNVYVATRNHRIRKITIE